MPTIKAQRRAFSLMAVVRMTAVFWLPLALSVPATGQSSNTDAIAIGRLLNLASAMILAHQSERAITQILDPINAQRVAAYGRLGEVINSPGDPPEVVLHRRAAAAAAPDARIRDPLWAEAVYLKGFALIDLGRIAEARDSLQLAIALYPTNSQYWIELAFTYEREKNLAKAMELYKRAESSAQAEQNPRSSEQLRRAWRGEAYDLVELGRLDEAEGLYRRCLELEPHDAMAQDQLAFLARLRSNGDRTQMSSGVKVDVTVQDSRRP